MNIIKSRGATITSSSNVIEILAVVSDIPPATPHVGQLWLDTSVNPPILKTYDGTNWQSSISNADKLDGQDSNYYLDRANHTGTQLPSTISPQGEGSGLDADKLDGQDGSYYLNRANHTGTQSPDTISPQGSGSGLNADMVDDLHADDFIAMNFFFGG
jgi:hypothetical protein